MWSSLLRPAGFCVYVVLGAVGRAAHACSVLGVLWPVGSLLLPLEPTEQRPLGAAVRKTVHFYFKLCFSG